MMGVLKLKRGTESNRTGITPADGEIIVTTDEKKLYLGDGSTAGGNLLGSVGGEIFAWARFNGINDSIQRQNNVSSITDMGNGVYRVNFSVNIGTSDYGIIGSVSMEDSNLQARIVSPVEDSPAPSATSLTFKTRSPNGNGIEADIVTIGIII